MDSLSSKISNSNNLLLATSNISGINSNLQGKIEKKKASSPALDNLSKIIEDAQSDDKKSVSPEVLKGLVDVNNDLNQVEDSLNFIEDLMSKGPLSLEDKKKILDLLFEMDKKLQKVDKKMEEILAMSKKDNKVSKQIEEMALQSSLFRKQSEEHRDLLHNIEPVALNVEAKPL